MKIIIATGGTGGHIFPAIAVAEQIKARHPEARILFVGSSNGMESRILPDKGWDFSGIPAVKLMRSGISSWLKAPFILLAAALDSLFTLLTFGPDVVLGAGGYASGPIVLLASLIRIPTAIIEQNTRAGRTNRILAMFVDEAYITFDMVREQFGSLKTYLTGNPLRADLAQAAETVDVKAPHTPPTLLVVGGSQGGRGVNNAVIEALPLLKRDIPSLHIIHQTGVPDYEIVVEAYKKHDFTNAEIQPFYDDVAAVYLRASVAVSRSGAGGVAELSAFGIPTVFIPFPYAADDHQRLNAESYIDASQAGRVLAQSGITGAALAEAVAEILLDTGAAALMRQRARCWSKPHAAADAAEKLLALAGLPLSPFARTHEEI